MVQGIQSGLLFHKHSNPGAVLGCTGWQLQLWFKLNPTVQGMKML